MKQCTYGVYGDNAKSLQLKDSKVYKTLYNNIVSYSAMNLFFRNTSFLGTTSDHAIYNNNGNILLQNCSVQNPDSTSYNASYSNNNAFTRFLNSVSFWTRTKASFGGPTRW